MIATTGKSSRSAPIARRRSWPGSPSNSARKSRLSATRSCLPELRQHLSGTNIEAAGGAQALCDAASRPADITVAAIVGCAGLAPDDGRDRARAHRRARQQGSAGFGGRRDDAAGRAARHHAAAGRFRAQRDLPVPPGQPDRRRALDHPHRQRRAAAHQDRSPNSKRSPPRRRWRIPTGIWARRSASIRPPCSTRGWNSSRRTTCSRSASTSCGSWSTRKA